MRKILSQSCILRTVEEQLALAIEFKITIKQLDRNLANALKVTPVFELNNDELLALKDCQVLCYYLSMTAGGNIFNNCVLIVKFKYDSNIDNIKDDLSNLTIQDEWKPPDVFDLDDKQRSKEFRSFIEYATTLSKEFKIKMKKTNTDEVKRQLIENLQGGSIYEI